jgi:hypothetical protein
MAMEARPLWTSFVATIASAVGVEEAVFGENPHKLIVPEEVSGDLLDGKNLVVRGVRGNRLLRRRGEYLGQSSAHAYETGGMRRLHLRGQENILKRLLLHVSGFNLSLLLRQWIGKGTPRGLQGLVGGVVSLFWLLGFVVQDSGRPWIKFQPAKRPAFAFLSRP